MLRQHRCADALAKRKPPDPAGVRVMRSAARKARCRLNAHMRERRRDSLSSRRDLCGLMAVPAVKTAGYCQMFLRNMGFGRSRSPSRSRSPTWTWLGHARPGMASPSDRPASFGSGVSGGSGWLDGWMVDGPGVWRAQDLSSVLRKRSATVRRGGAFGRSGRRVADRDGRVARSTLGFVAPGQGESNQIKPIFDL